ncbi:MAG TPA: C4-type zinc ribbon domain-containing protein [Vicinamibacterales bacterium]|nr:C4-type zinc ribbon domain-containing protein [Vicinamibacterales bacterium]
MNPDIQHLIRLQQLDTEIDAARRRIADIPSVQAALAARLDRAGAALAAVKERLTANQADRKKIEAEVASIQTRLSKYKGQLLELKTNKEYQTMLHEIATAEAAIRSHEDVLLERMEEAENLTRELKAAEAELQSQQSAVAAERAALDEEAMTLHRRVDETTAARGAAAAQLAPDTLRLFEHVARQRKGQAVAEARDGTCSVCHVRMRPQIYNEVRRGEALIQCESCQRILFFVPATATHPS